MAHTPKPISATILLSHTHWDHIQGFPFFASLFVPGNQITGLLTFIEGSGHSLREVLSGQMEFTYFPVEIGQFLRPPSPSENSEKVRTRSAARGSSRSISIIRQ